MMTRSQISIYAAEAKRISRQLSTTHTHRKQAPLVHAWAAAMKGALSNGDPRAVLCGEEEAMHYYQFHVGDYRRDTAHLTLLEHGAYRQLLDWYYLDETPIPKETDLVFRRLSARTDEEKKAVLAVLNDFFMLTDAGYVQERADEEIRAYQNRADIARENGKKGGRPRKTTQDNPTANPAGYFGKANVSQQKANQEPLTNNKYISSESSGVAMSVSRFEDFWKAYPPTGRKVAKATCAKRWADRQLDQLADKIISHVTAVRETKQWREGFEPAPLTYINQSRWNDDLPEQPADPSTAENMFEGAI